MSRHNLPNVVAKNLKHLIAQQKSRAMDMPLQLKLMNRATQIFGSSWFLWINIGIFVTWILVNVVGSTLLKPFDPYPFEFLTLSVSLEAIVLSIVVLIAQNKLQSDSDERALLDLHINLLAENETTMILKKLDRIEKHLGIEVSEAEAKRVQDLIEETHPEMLAEFIHQAFCDEVGDIQKTKK